MHGFSYRPSARSLKDSNIIIRSQVQTAPSTLPADDVGNSFSAAQIAWILRAPSRSGNGTVVAPNTLIVIVRRLVPLSSAEAEADPYRKFPFYVAGSLFRNEFLRPEIISPEDILCPFARTPFKELGQMQHGDKVHVLPLNRVSTFSVIIVQMLTSI